MPYYFLDRPSSRHQTVTCGLWLYLRLFQMLMTCLPGWGVMRIQLWLYREYIGENAKSNKIYDKMIKKRLGG